MLPCCTKPTGPRKTTCQDKIILFITVCIQVCIIFAFGFEASAIDTDLQWNRILHGEEGFPEIEVKIQEGVTNPVSKDTKGYFYQQELFLDKAVWAEERDTLYRDVLLEAIYLTMLFIIFGIIVGYQVVFFCCEHYVTPRRAKMAVMLLYIGLTYGLLAALSCSSSSFAEIKDDYVEMHNKLYHRLKEGNRSTVQDYTSIEFENLDQVLFLMDIMGICVQNSIYLAFNPSRNFPVDLLEQVTMYDGQVLKVGDFKNLRFCQYDIFKTISVFFVLDGALLSLLIPFLLGFWLRKMEIPKKEENRELVRSVSGVYSGNLPTAASSAFTLDSTADQGQSAGSEDSKAYG